ncbi:VOC family protein [Streptomyces sp. NPDC090045]|uniref:VOC family protein n=1 Tax=Streptomyces sp. NPDC090045 TaxID=3365927 RepID=UPI003827774F
MPDGCGGDQSPRFGPAPALSPCLGVPDTQAAVEFCEKIGFTALPAGGDPDGDRRILLFGGEFALMVYRDDHLRAWLPYLKDTPVGAFGMFCLAVEDFGSYVERIRPLVTVQKDVMEHGGQKLFYFADPDGYVIAAAQKQKRDAVHSAREACGVLGPRRQGARRLLRSRAGLEGHPYLRQNRGDGERLGGAIPRQPMRRYGRPQQRPEIAPHPEEGNRPSRDPSCCSRRIQRLFGE